MSLYNMVAGHNPAGGRLLAAIQLSPETVPRIRDVWVNADMTEVTVYTRTGGGNRADYVEENRQLTQHPLYLRDTDDTFDSTFALFTFKMPAEAAAEMQQEMQQIIDLLPDNVKESTRARIMSRITETGPDRMAKVLAELRRE